jgi:hypothetical protein
MTVTEQVESLSRDVEELRSVEKEAERKEIIRKLSSIIRDLRRLSESASEVYGAATVLAPRLESAELAVEVWEDIRKNFEHVFAALERVPKVEPGIDNLIEESAIIFHDLVQKSSKAVLEWGAKAELDRCDALAIEGFAILDAEEKAKLLD